MPVDPTHEYADTAHPSTIVKEDYLYGCNSCRSGDGSPRGKKGEYIASVWGPFPEVVKTDWSSKKCGHTLRVTDPACTGCVNRFED